MAAAPNIRACAVNLAAGIGTRGRAAGARLEWEMAGMPVHELDGCRGYQPGASPTVVNAIGPLRK